MTLVYHVGFTVAAATVAVGFLAAISAVGWAIRDHGHRADRCRWCCQHSEGAE